MALSRHLTDTEKLQRAFDTHDGEMELELKKGFFYVINPDNRIIDCAKIYTF